MNAMITVKIPYRISYFGGGSDYPVWYRKHGGAVLTSTIRKYCYVMCRPMSVCAKCKYRIVYSKIEEVDEIAQIEHPAVRGVLQYLQPAGGLEIIHLGDLPARSGLGSSSAFTVALIKAISALQGRQINKLELAREAIHVEHNIIKECVGIQDQIETAYGGINKISFNKDDSFNVYPVKISAERLKELHDHLLLFFTGITRYAPQMAIKQVQNIAKKDCHITEMISLVDEGRRILSDSSDICEFGRLLDVAWQIKRSIAAGISNDIVDSYFSKAMKAGALGGKLLGAGGGGFMLIFAEPHRHLEIIAALSSLKLVPFEFEHDLTEHSEAAPPATEFLSNASAGVVV